MDENSKQIVKVLFLVSEFIEKEITTDLYEAIRGATAMLKTDPTVKAFCNSLVTKKISQILLEDSNLTKFRKIGIIQDCIMEIEEGLIHE